MIVGYARVSTDGQSLEAQQAALAAAGAERVFAEKISGAVTDRSALGKAVAALGADRSLGDPWADTTTPHGRLMLTVLGGLAEFERHLILARTSEGRQRAKARGIKFGRKP